MLRWPACAPATALIVSLAGTFAQTEERSGLKVHQPEPAGQVRRCGRWLVAETPSFWVCCYSEELPAGDIGRHCDTLRSQLCRKWLGEETPASWSPKCSIVLHPDRNSYLAAAGQEAASTAGSSLVERRAGSIVTRRVDLRGDRLDCLTAALPHELTHVILADRFASQSLPRWADEGMAILADTEAKRALHIRGLQSGWARGAVFPVRELLPLRDYPSPERWDVFYGQSTSLVQYLVGQGTPHQFVEFLQQAAAEGYDRALRKSYGISSMDELDRLWRASLPSSSPALAKTP